MKGDIGALMPMLLPEDKPMTTQLGTDSSFSEKGRMTQKTQGRI